MRPNKARRTKTPTGSPRWCRRFQNPLRGHCSQFIMTSFILMTGVGGVWRPLWGRWYSLRVPVGAGERSLHIGGQTGVPVVLRELTRADSYSSAALCLARVWALKFGISYSKWGGWGSYRNYIYLSCRLLILVIQFQIWIYLQFAWFEVIVTVIMRTAIFWDVTQYSPVEAPLTFRGEYTASIFRVQA
jgi:hypothetical protein